MKKIIFLRPSPYNDIIEGKDLITSFDLVGKQKFDIKVDNITLSTKKKINKFIKDLQFKNVISSPSLRAQSTAKYFSSSYKICHEIGELKFELKNDIPKKFLQQDKNFSIDVLRYELVKSFTLSKTKESPSSVLSRINSYINYISNLEGNTVCFSHAFIMKFYEIFLENAKNFKVEMFLTEYNWLKKPYDFLEGFSVELDNRNKVKNIKFISIPQKIWDK